ncbi:hypothetical protein COOONC_24940, partial [Cooperia oncophora]
VIIDKKTGKCKGFAIVEFVFPESAVAAYAAADGTIFKSHSWNALFLGPNAIADTLAEKLGVEKGDLLNSEGGESAGVRLALAETRLVREDERVLHSKWRLSRRVFSTCCEKKAVAAVFPEQC